MTKYYWATVSNIFTLLRIFFIPFIVYALIAEQWGWACVLFALAAFTDSIDGTLARLLQQETQLGAYLDPLADKLLLVSCYITLIFVKYPLFKIPVWFTALIVIKEVLLIAGAFYWGVLKNSITIRPTVLGKLTTCVQILFIVSILLGAFLQKVPADLLYSFLVFIIILNIAVLLQYGSMSYRGLQS